MAVMTVKKQDMKYAIPFGPFLSAAAIAYIFLGNSYIRLFLIGY